MNIIVDYLISKLPNIFGRNRNVLGKVIKDGPGENVVVNVTPNEQFKPKLDCGLIEYARKRVSQGETVESIAVDFKVSARILVKALDCKSYKKCCKDK